MVPQTALHEVAKRTEGLDLALLSLPHLRHNLPRLKSTIKETHASEMLENEEIQSVSLSPDAIMTRSRIIPDSLIWILNNKLLQKPSLEAQP